jgi:hypothetical protein
VAAMTAWPHRHRGPGCQRQLHRRDVLWRAWVAVRRNNGTAGIDKITLADAEEYGVDRLLGELAQDLKGGRWRRPLPARRVLIPKPGTVEQRPLSIPSVRDRIVQAALKIVLEPIFEADFLPCSFGFRPRRSAHDALQVLIDESWRGRRWVVETDIAHARRSATLGIGCAGSSRVRARVAGGDLRAAESVPLLGAEERVGRRHAALPGVHQPRAGASRRRLVHRHGGRGSQCRRHPVPKPGDRDRPTPTVAVAPLSARR